MGLSEFEMSRLFAGEATTDDPALQHVSTFLDDLRRDYPPADVDRTRVRHLTAIAQEVRPTPVRPLRRRPQRRWAVALVAATLSVLTAGVGVATAMGHGPLTLLPGLLLGSPGASRSAPALPPSAVATPSQQQVTSNPSAPGKPQPAETPTSKATAKPSEADPDHAKSNTGKSSNGKSKTTKSNNGKSDRAKAERGRPTAKATHPGRGRSDPPAKGRTAKSSPRAPEETAG